MRMEVVKKLCTAMLVFCLSLAVFVGPAEASYRCAVEPSHVYFPDVCEHNICRNTVVSVDGKELSNVYARFNSREEFEQGITFEIVNQEIITVPVQGTSTLDRPQSVKRVFPDPQPAFTQFQVNAFDPLFKIDVYVDGYCADAE
jgi:hypothetical protein